MPGSDKMQKIMGHGHHVNRSNKKATGKITETIFSRQWPEVYD